MIHEPSLRAVAEARLPFGEPSWRRPLYDSYSFAALPGTVLSLLTGESSWPALPEGCVTKGPFPTVILLFIDGFGWRFFEEYQDRYPFLKRFLTSGIATKLTSQFPSTTAPHVTCLSTGLQVGESGIYEWFIYDPDLDEIVAPLLFSVAGDRSQGSLSALGVNPAEYYPKETLYQTLDRRGIPSFVAQEAAIAHSAYSEALFRGAHLLPYRNFSRMLDDIVTRLPGGGYFYIYVGDIDAKGHRQGIDSNPTREVIDACFTALEKALWAPLSLQQKKTALLVIADHGMIPIHPAKTIYLNREIPELEPLLKKTKKGRAIAPVGSCRDFFLHVEKENEARVRELVSRHLGSRATVLPTKDLLRENLFGSRPPSSRFLQRLGDLVILPHGEESVWWYEKGRFEQNFHAMHGGLSDREMETICLFHEL
jgi:hypothetical protein